MASAAEQLAQNMNFSSFAKAKELHQRILFTIGILIVYRIGTFVPIPGINPVQYAELFRNLGGKGAHWSYAAGFLSISRLLKATSKCRRLVYLAFKSDMRLRCSR